MFSSLKILLLVFATALVACSAVPSKPDTAAFDPGPWLEDLAVARTAIVTKYACRDPEQTWGCERRFVTMWGQAEYSVNYGGRSHAIRCLD
jgi:hypothetical protein